MKIQEDKHAKLKAFLTDRRELNIRQVESNSKIPIRTLYRFMNGYVSTIAEVHWPNLEKVLEKYGWGRSVE